MSDLYKDRKELAARFKNYQNIFIALGDQTRQKILFTLLENEELGMRVNEIARLTPLSRPAVSHHLKILKEAKIVSVDRIGTKNYYHINIDATFWKQFSEISEDIYQRVKIISNHKEDNHESYL